MIVAIVKGIRNRDKSWSIKIDISGKSYGIGNDARFLSEKGLLDLEERLKRAHVFVITDAECIDNIKDIPEIAKEGKICPRKYIQLLVRVLKKPSCS